MLGSSDAGGAMRRRDSIALLGSAGHVLTADFAANLCAEATGRALSPCRAHPRGNEANRGIIDRACPCYDATVTGKNLMPVGRTNRRAFIAGLGGAVAWPLAAPGQQTAMPLVGWLGVNTPELGVPWIAAMRQGLNDVGYVDGQNVTIEYRWAENQSNRLPALAADLIERNPAVIVASPYPTQQPVFLLDIVE